MKKILLIIEVPGLLRHLQPLLLKLGFDVHGIAQELSLSEQLISFHPDLLIVAGQGKKIRVESILRRIQGQRKAPKVLNMVEDLKNKTVVKGVDCELSLPLLIDELVLALAELLRLDLETLRSRLNLTASQKKEGGKSHAKVNVSFEDPQRRDKYLKIVEKMEIPEQKSLNKGLGQHLMKKQLQEMDAEGLEDLDQQRKAFVEAMYKKETG